eukprot:Skav228909  [mRNA]  locus=scaffold118:117323:122190:+ [translate_table: standard]
MDSPAVSLAASPAIGIIELQKTSRIDFDVAPAEPFWTGTKRRPIEAKWDPENPPAEAMEYLYATANCYAFMWKVPFVRNRGAFEKQVVALRLQVPEWSPPSAGKVETEEDDGDKVDPAAIEALKAELYAVNPAELAECEAHDFEKDDDTNFHIDFLTVSTNLRASNYDIRHTERSTVKVTAGRIIPALAATTTAMICGLVDVEFLKLVLGTEVMNCAMNLFRPEYRAEEFRFYDHQRQAALRPAIVLKTNLRARTLAVDRSACV